MNRQFNVYRRAFTSLPPDEILAAMEHSLKVTVGGTVVRDRNKFLIENGNKNLDGFAFLANVNAEIVLTQPAANTIDIYGTVTLRPSFWLYFLCILGLCCMWFLWLFLIPYFMMQPYRNYQLAIDRADLSGNMSGPPPI